MSNQRDPNDSRDPKTFFLEQFLFTEGMTPLEKVMVLDSVTNLVVNMLTEGKKKASDLRDDVLEQIGSAQYKLLIDPKTAQTENPRILHIYNGTKRVFDVLFGKGDSPFKPKGGRLVGGGLMEQIQHHSQILNATTTKLNKLRQRQPKLVRQAEALRQAFQERGEAFGMNHPQVQQLGRAFDKLEGQIAQLEGKSQQISQLIEQLYVQMENQPAVQDENA
jgi:ABC-type phosphate transport system auxiliary subunit